MLSADIFCKVVDNYGDIGVCWRLARQLAAEHGLAVRLWVDDLHSFARLAPSLNPELAEQPLGQITVAYWPGEIARPQPADLVIEGFACNLPAGYLLAMAARQPAPLWFNLEYLSAESWVEGCHALPSIHPATGLRQYFWFPGFTDRTGGLLREAGLLAERDAFQGSAEVQSAFWKGLGLPDAMSYGRRLSLFAYENESVSRFLDTLADDSTRSLVVIPVSRVLPDVARWLGRPELKVGDRCSRGNVEVAVLPLLSGADYDHLLWACDLNAVRGEDSFVRAQWAGRPLLWHIYPQQEDAHLVKLEAFIGLADLPEPWPALMRAWNGSGATTAEWAALWRQLPVLTAASVAWAESLAAPTDLATGLMHFYRSQVE